MSVEPGRQVIDVWLLSQSPVHLPTAAVAQVRGAGRVRMHAAPTVCSVTRRRRLGRLLASFGAPADKPSNYRRRWPTTDGVTIDIPCDVHRGWHGFVWTFLDEAESRTRRPPGGPSWSPATRTTSARAACAAHGAAGGPRCTSPSFLAIPSTTPTFLRGAMYCLVKAEKVLVWY